MSRSSQSKSARWQTRIDHLVVAAYPTSTTDISTMPTTMWNKSPNGQYLQRHTESAAAHTRHRSTRNAANTQRKAQLP